MLWSVLCILVVIFIAVYDAVIRWIYSYWSRRNVPHLKPHLITGNIKNIFWKRKPYSLQISEYYLTMKAKGCKIAGYYIFSKPACVLLDPELIKLVLSQDFGSFVNRIFYHNDEHDPMNRHLISLRGEEWRSMRKLLSPVFTPSKIKMILPNVILCAEDLLIKIDESGVAIDVKELASIYTTNVILSCFFGIEGNSDFLYYGKLQFKPVWYTIIKRFFQLAFPNLSRKLGVTTFDPAAANFFSQIVQKMLENRKFVTQNGTDLLQILLKEKQLSSIEIYGQAIGFYIAGYETSASTMAFCLYELSLHPELQENLRREVCNDNALTFESIMEMKYLDQIVNETLRKYPPVPLNGRVCNERYKIPNTNVTIDEGLNVLIPVYGIHHDPEFYPNPEKFDPDRFSEEGRKKLPPYSFLPFGEGPRQCIAYKFGLLQIKIGLISIIRNFKILPCKLTPKKITVDPNVVLVLSSEETIYLTVERISV